jgi:antirestriction protein ArdC
MNTQFNPVSHAVFSGRNEASALEAKAEHGYKSNKWITYFQAKELDLLDGVTLKDKAVGMVRFAKNAANGKSEAKWYNVFNLDLFTDVPKEVLNAKPSAKKATKKTAAKAAPKVARKTTKKASSIDKIAAKVPADSGFQPEAIPVKGMPGVFLMTQENGTFIQVTL